MRVRVAEGGSLTWRSGAAVWDDHLRHQQLALTEMSLDVVRWFADWRELDSAEELGERHAKVAYRLLEAGVLVAEDSASHRRERELGAAWQAWGGAAERFHFASRTTDATAFASPAGA
jgi:hypothetical protein